MEKDAQREQNFSEGAEAALSSVARGKLDRCNVGELVMLCGKLLPSPSLPPSPPDFTPQPGREQLGPPQRRLSGGGDSVLNLCSNLETARRGPQSVNLMRQQGPLGPLAGVCF